jgi:hypothetical protein
MNAAAQYAAQVAQREALKKGKSEEQKKAIDFLYKAGNGGCLGGKASMTMQEYMGLVQRKCRAMNLQARALQKIGLDPSQVQEIPPIVLSSFVYDDDCLIRVDSNIAVSSQYSITWIFFSATQMYTYKYIFDTTSDNTWELTKDFFYSDIKSIRTAHEVEELIIETTESGCFKKKQKFIHRNKHWDALHITVPGESYSFVCRTTDTLEQSIQAAKAMIREKKEA